MDHFLAARLKFTAALKSGRKCVQIEPASLILFAFHTFKAQTFIWSCVIAYWKSISIRWRRTEHLHTAVHTQWAVYSKLPDALGLLNFLFCFSSCNDSLICSCLIGNIIDSVTTDDQRWCNVLHLQEKSCSQCGYIMVFTSLYWSV